MLRDSIQARRQAAHVHLCKTGILPPEIAQSLLCSVVLFVLWPSVTVVAPVVRIALRPRLLGGALIEPIIEIGLKFGSLPLALAGALAVGRGSVGLTRNLWARLERLATAGAEGARHRSSPYENSYGNCWPVAAIREA